MSNRPGVLSLLVLVVGCACARQAWPPSQDLAHRSNQLPDSVRNAVERFLDEVATPRDARARGYYELQPASSDFELNPMSGIHWTNEAFTVAHGPALNSPSFVMFYPFPDGLRAVGVAYAVRKLSHDPTPHSLLADGENWHDHIPCHGLERATQLLISSVDGCRGLGGRVGEVKISMVHVWTRFPSPDGPFALNNPVLPFLAVGLEPPHVSEFSGPEGPRLRMLSLALAETVRGRPRLGALIDPNPESPFSLYVQPHRDSIRSIVDSLSAIPGLDEDLVEAAIEQWSHIRSAYSRLSDSRTLRIMIEQWFEMVIRGPGSQSGH